MPGRPARTAATKSQKRDYDSSEDSQDQNHVPDPPSDEDSDFNDDDEEGGGRNKKGGARGGKAKGGKAKGKGKGKGKQQQVIQDSEDEDEENAPVMKPPSNPRSRKALTPLSHGSGEPDGEGENQTLDAEDPKLNDLVVPLNASGNLNQHRSPLRPSNSNVPPPSARKKLQGRTSLTASGSGMVNGLTPQRQPSAANVVGHGGKTPMRGGGVAALRRAAGHRGGVGDASFIEEGGAPGGGQVPWETMNTNYEEWIKLATDNKITTSNTWSLALIDYFADSNLRLLRNNEEEGGGINFQKASTTLDGCVKIWTSRVDSVATETGKLLTGLREEANAAAKGLGVQGGDGNAEADDEEELRRARREKRKATRATTTLADDYSTKLKAKSLDLEFTVDPLFKKTCADFDEAGAAGLLMNHLGIDGKGRVVFDAGDAGVGREEDEEDVMEDDVMEDEGEVEGKRNGDKGKGKEKAKEPEKDPWVDVGKLEAKFLPPQILSTLASRTLCPSFSAFKMASSDPSSSTSGFDLNFFNPSQNNEDQEGGDGSDHQLPLPINADDAGAQDFFADAGAGGGFDDDGGDLGGFEFPAGDGDVEEGEELVARAGFTGAHHPQPNGFGPMGAAGGEGGGEGGEYPIEPFDPFRHPNERDLVMALSDRGGDQMFDYFDKALTRNWAGPEHWKMAGRRVPPPRPGANKDKADGTAPKRKERTPFSISFEGPAPLTQKELFAPSTTSTTLKEWSSSSKRKGSKDKRSKKKRETYLLPDDIHFSSAQLLRLFLKPKALINMRRRHAGFGPNNQGNGDRPEDQQEVDEHYWAQAAADAAADQAGEPIEVDDAAPALPFSTQFFAEDDDDPSPYFEEELGDVPMNGEAEGGEGEGSGVNGVDAGGVEEEEDLLTATQGQLKRVRPEVVRYTKRAKRVDVRRLKETIWRELEGGVEKLDESADAKDNNNPPDQPKQATFTKVLEGLQKAYPKDKLSEISTSFCFICLLHLCNEKGLRIQRDGVPIAINSAPGADEEDEDGLGVGKAVTTVGGLTQLQVLKEMILGVTADGEEEEEDTEEEV